MRGMVGALPAAALSALVLAGCGSSGPSPTRVSACASQVKTGVLPQWARGGFSDPKPRMPYEVGRADSIAALVWGFPLLSPSPRKHNNKILWVSRVTTQPGSNLRIAAQRMQGHQAGRRPGLADGHGRSRPLDHQPAGIRMLAPDAALVGPRGLPGPGLRLQPRRVTSRACLASHS
ncbi:MAG: hypothetical protein ACXVSU_09880 [Solirubrobacteraceae bacterium]